MRKWQQPRQSQLLKCIQKIEKENKVFITEANSHHFFYSVAAEHRISDLFVVVYRILFVTVDDVNKISILRPDFIRYYAVANVKTHYFRINFFDTFYGKL